MKYYLEKEDWKDIVQREYIENNKSRKEVAEILGVSVRQFERYTEIEGIVKRFRSSKEWRLKNKDKFDAELKQCRICNEWKKEKEFPKKLDKRHSICRECNAKVHGTVNSKVKKLIKILKLRQYVLLYGQVTLDQIKFCNKCKNWKKVEKFRGRKNRPGGGSDTCNVCRNKRIREVRSQLPIDGFKNVRLSTSWKREHKDKFDAGLKQCSICGEWKSKEKFSKKGKLRRSACKKCRAKKWVSAYSNINTQRKKLIKILKLRHYNLLHNKALLSQIKYCNSCTEWKKKIDFYKDKEKYDGLQCKCSKCTNEDMRRRWTFASTETRKRKAVQSNKWASKRKKTDLSFKIGRNVGKSIQFHVRGGKNNRHWKDLLGYTFEDLRIHLESKFEDGMNWDNYGLYGWHMDHIRPVSSFNFKSKLDTEKIKECWGLENLQPLWAKDNLNKGAKLNWKKENK